MSAEDAKIMYEAGQDVTAMSQLTDSGDHKTFTSGAELWSDVAGYAPVIMPDGVLDGGVVTPAAAGGDNTVDVSAGRANVGGAVVTFSAATDVAASRGADTDTHRITSIVVNGSGVVSAIAGIDGTAFSETRGADGGPPFIPVDSVELAQVRFSALAAAAVASGEVLAVPGSHRELAAEPPIDPNFLEARAEALVALPTIHTGGVTKGVYASYAEPVFTEVPIAKDFTPPETAYSLSSEQAYRRVIGQSSKSLNAGSFTAYLRNGVTDSLLQFVGKNLWFKFFPSEYSAEHILCQGVLGVTRSFPASGSITAACTIAAAEEGVNRAS